MILDFNGRRLLLTFWMEWREKEDSVLRFVVLQYSREMIVRVRCGEY